MKYKKKLVLLISLIFACVLLLFFSFLFDRENINTRTSFYAWLNKTWLSQADRIVMKSAYAQEPIMLIRKKDYWFVLVREMEYPAKQEKIDDLFNLLSQRSAYPLRSTTAASHERLGVTEQAASRIIVYGGASQFPLLDLLIGSGNDAGNEIYLRKNGSNEVRSGDDQFTQYSDAERNVWFDLRLFEKKDFSLNSKMIQRLSVSQKSAESKSSYVLSRQAADNITFWKIDASPDTVLDNNKTESYFKMLLSSEAVDFAVDSVSSNYDFSFGKIELLLDDLSVIHIIFAGENEKGQYPTMISGSPFVYLVPKWIAERIIREAKYFYDE